MKYMGGKSKLAKYLLPIILKDRKEGQWYVEPFVGGCNMIDKVDGPRIGNDIHKELIAMFIALQNGWIPPDEVSEEMYKDCRNRKYEDHIVGFVGFACSYAAKWFGGYARGKTNKGEPRNYASEGKRHLLKQKPCIDGVQFFNKQYWELDIPPNSLIYCDPPYHGTTKYCIGQFDHERFWDWCLKMGKDGHTVYISEYSMPSSFKCVWHKEVFNSLTKDTGGKIGVEKLFVVGENNAN